MNFKSFLVKPLVAAALIATAGASQAAITVYTSLAAFTAATSAPGTDTFAGLSVTAGTPSPITRSAGAYGYTADAGPAGTFFAGGTLANPFLSTNTFSDTITFNAFTGGVAAIGGNFFGSNLAGAFLSGNMTLVATDSLGAVNTQTLVAATQTNFLGFVSTGTMSSLTLCAVNATLGRCVGPLDTAVAPFVWPSADNLVLAKAVSAIPEPSTYAMLMAGLGAVGFIARRRRS
jgi:PEP-CTERM motif